MASVRLGERHNWEDVPHDYEGLREQYEALRCSEEMYRVALSLTDHTVTVIDIPNRTLNQIYNEGSWSGIASSMPDAPESVIAAGIIHPDDQEGYRQFYRDIYAGVPRCECTMRVMEENRGWVWFTMYTQTIYDCDGKPDRAIAWSDDITVREKARALYRQYRDAVTMDAGYVWEANLSSDELIAEDAMSESFFEKSEFIKYTDIAKEACRHVPGAKRDELRETFSRQALLDAFEEGRREVSFEYPFIAAQTGDEMWLKSTAYLTLSADGDICAIICSRNVTEQVNYKRASIEYREAYERLSSTVLYGIAKYQNDEDLTIVFANDVYYQMHGFASEDEAVAAGFTNVMFMINDETKPVARNNYKGIVEGNVRRYNVEYPCIDINGKLVWLLCCVGYSIEDDMFNASILDITDRKEVEEKLAIRDRDYQTALQLTDRQVFIYDIYAKQAEWSMTGEGLSSTSDSADGIASAAFDRWLVAEESVQEYQAFMEAMEGGEENGSALICMYRSPERDEPHWYACDFRMIRDETGRPVHAIVSFADVTDQKEREIAYRKQRQALDGMDERRYVAYECNLTRNRLENEGGRAVAPVMDKIDGTLEAFTDYMAEHFIEDESLDEFRAFVAPVRLMHLWRSNILEDSIVMRGLDDDGCVLWFKMGFQLLRDPYSNDVKAFYIIENIDEEQTRQLELRNQLAQAEKELERSRIKVMMSQMQPHFLYNALSAIRSIIMQDPQYAYDLLYDFTTYLRANVRALSDDSPISFDQELLNIKAYLSIEGVRFRDKLTCVYDIQTEDFEVIPLSIQPLVENAVRHGIFQRGKKGGTMTLATEETVTDYLVRVSDDGVGFNIDDMFDTASDSVGLKSLIYRLESLLGAKVFIDSTVGEGTDVVVAIPKRKREDA